MSQIIVKDYPPNYDEIATAFGLVHQRVGGILFSYGDRIYNPSGMHIPASLRVHEAVHGRQQGYDPAGWWERYIDSQAFRLGEEIEAHQAEYRYVIEHGSRAERRTARKLIAQRLSSPLYGKMIGKSAARAILAQL